MLTITTTVDYTEIRCRIHLALIDKLVKIIENVISQKGVEDSAALTIVSEELLRNVLTSGARKEDTSVSLLYRIDFLEGSRCKIEIRHLGSEGRNDRKKLRNAIEGSIITMLSKMIIFDTEGRWIAAIVDVQGDPAKTVIS